MTKKDGICGLHFYLPTMRPARTLPMQSLLMTRVIQGRLISSSLLFRVEALRHCIGIAPVIIYVEISSRLELNVKHNRRYSDTKAMQRGRPWVEHRAGLKISAAYLLFILISWRMTSFSFMNHSVIVCLR